MLGAQPVLAGDAPTCNFFAVHEHSVVTRLLPGSDVIFADGFGDDVLD